MKKIFILLLLVLMCSGCYDNVELDNLAIINGIGIDYVDNKYILTYEILNDTKTQNNEAMLSYTVTGSGRTISEAFTNTNYKVSKKSYFAHLSLVIVHKNILNEKLENITDFLLRDTNIRSKFKLVGTSNNTPEEILKNNSDNHPVVSEQIVDLLDNEVYNNNIVNNDSFTDIASKLISKKHDVIINSISLENDEITLSDSFMLKEYNYQNILSKENSAIYNLLTKNVITAEFQKNYENGLVAITINQSDSSIDVKNDKIIINTDLEAKIIQNEAGFDLTKDDAYKKLNKEFEKIVKESIHNFIKTIQENKSDILGLQDIYYRKYKKDNHNLWESADINIKVNLKINTKGFIFEVNK